MTDNQMYVETDSNEYGTRRQWEPQYEEDLPDVLWYVKGEHFQDVRTGRKWRIQGNTRNNIATLRRYAKVGYYGFDAQYLGSTRPEIEEF